MQRRRVNTKLLRGTNDFDIDRRLSRLPSTETSLRQFIVVCLLFANSRLLWKPSTNTTLGLVQYRLRSVALCRASNKSHDYITIISNILSKKALSDIMHRRILLSGLSLLGPVLGAAVFGDLAGRAPPPAACRSIVASVLSSASVSLPTLCQGPAPPATVAAVWSSWSTAHATEYSSFVSLCQPWAGSGSGLGLGPPGGPPCVSGIPTGPPGWIPTGTLGPPGWAPTGGPRGPGGAGGAGTVTGSVWEPASTGDVASGSTDATATPVVTDTPTTAGAGLSTSTAAAVSPGNAVPATGGSAMVKAQLAVGSLVFAFLGGLANFV